MDFFEFIRGQFDRFKKQVEAENDPSQKHTETIEEIFHQNLSTLHNEYHSITTAKPHVFYAFFTRFSQKKHSKSTGNTTAFERYMPTVVPNAPTEPKDHPAIQSK